MECILKAKIFAIIILQFLFMNCVSDNTPRSLEGEGVDIIKIDNMNAVNKEAKDSTKRSEDFITVLNESKKIKEEKLLKKKSYLKAYKDRLKRVEICDDLIDIDENYLQNLYKISEISEDYINYEDEGFLPKQIICRLDSLSNKYVAIMHSESSHLTDLVAVIEIENFNSIELFTLGYLYFSEGEEKYVTSTIHKGIITRRCIIHQWHYDDSSSRITDMLDTIITRYDTYSNKEF